MAETKTAPTTPAAAQARAAARKAAPSAKQAALMSALTRGTRVVVQNTPTGSHRISYTTPTGKSKEAPGSFACATITAVAGRGWLDRVGGDEATSIYSLSEAGRKALKAAKTA